MPEEKIEEETYSVIFTSLKHPIRRRILRMLDSKTLTFSEILESLSIDSGHLSYHLESLGDLVTRSQDGKYALSSIGIAAVKLMSGVEEHPAKPPRKESKVALGAVNVHLLILIGALIVASLIFVSFTNASTDEGPTYPGSTLLIRPSQTFEFNITIVYKPRTEVRTWENSSLYHEKEPPINTLTTWETGWFWFDLQSNETYDVSISIYDPDGTVGRSFRETNMAPGVLMVGLGLNEITQPGTYRLEIKNNAPQEMHGILRVHEGWEHFEKPYFYYGIAGFLVALLYPVLILFKLLKDWAFKPKSQVASLFH